MSVTRVKGKDISPQLSARAARRLSTTRQFLAATEAQANPLPSPRNGSPTLNIPTTGPLLLPPLSPRRPSTSTRSRRSTSSAGKQNPKVVRFDDLEEKSADTAENERVISLAKQNTFFAPQPLPGRKSSLTSRKASPEPDYALLNGLKVIMEPSRLARLRLLLQYVAYGAKAAAEGIINSDRELLLYSGPIIKDYSNRNIQQTAYQMAIAADDVNFAWRKYPKREEMAEMIKRHLKLSSTPDGAEKQYQSLYPDEHKEQEQKKIADDSQALQKAFWAIKNANSSKEAIAAYHEIKNYLEPKENEVITFGNHYNKHLLLEAQELSNSYYLKNINYSRWDIMGLKLSSPELWQLVIGLIQNLQPACMAMALCQQDLPSLIEGKKKLNRSLAMQCNGGVYYPSDPMDRNELGINCVVGCTITADWQYHSSFLKPSEAINQPIKPHQDFLAFCQAKEEGRQALLAEPEVVVEAEEKKGCMNKCSIM